jgi:hypothetical protein
MINIEKPVSFEWDKGNIDKNLIKHGVTNEEAEEIFFDSEKKLLKDILHSDGESRFVCLGETKLGRILFVVFTIRISKIRIISARDLNQREKKLYEK